MAGPNLAVEAVLEDSLLPIAHISYTETMVAPPVSGIYTPIPTFFKKDGVTVDYQASVDLCTFLRDNGVKGAAVMGSTGEGVHLSRQERHDVIKAVAEGVPNFAVLGGVVQNSLSDVFAEIESIKDAGATHALILPSNYYGAGIKQQGIIEWFTTVADKSPLPVIVYVYPGVANGLNIDPFTILELSKHPNIVGCKISHGDVSHYSIVGLDPETPKNNFSPFTGLGQILLPALTCGFQGTIDALSGAFPKAYVALFDAYQAGDLKKAQALQNTISRGEEIVVRYGVIGIKRAICLATGIGETYLGRAPLNQDLPEGAWEATMNLFTEMKELEATL